LAKSRGSLDVSTLEGWLWEAACAIRGPLDAPKFKDYILPLSSSNVSLMSSRTRSSALGGEFGGKEIAADLVEQDHELVRFYIARAQVLGQRHRRRR